MNGLGVFDDGAVFLERGGGAVGQWFLDNGLMQDFGILDMNGIWAAYRAVKTSPPFCLGGPPVLIPPATDECEDEAPQRPYVCPECNGAFETLRQLVAHQNRKHGCRHPPGIVTVTNTCVWCRNIYRDRRAWKRGYCTGRGTHLHTVVVQVNITCSHCDQHFESVAMLLEHLRTEFPLDRRNAELGLDVGAGNAGGEATETEAPSRRTGAAEPRHTEANAANSIPALEHDLAPTFCTILVKHDEPLVQASKAATGLFVTKSQEGQRPPDEPHVHGWAAMMTALTTDTALSAEDKQKVVAYTSSANSPETLLQSVYLEPVQKTFQKDWVKWQCSVDPQTQPILCLIIKAMRARSAKEKFGQAPAGGNVCELQQMLDDL